METATAAGGFYTGGDMLETDEDSMAVKVEFPRRRMQEKELENRSPKTVTEEGNFVRSKVDSIQAPHYCFFLNRSQTPLSIVAPVAMYVSCNFPRAFRQTPLSSLYPLAPSYAHRRRPSILEVVQSSLEVVQLSYQIREYRRIHLYIHTW